MTILDRMKEHAARENKRARALWDSHHGGTGYANVSRVELRNLAAKGLTPHEIHKATGCHPYTIRKALEE